MHISRPTAILFDWDNTLVSTFEMIHKAINHTMSHFGKPLWTIEQVKEKAHGSARETFPAIFGSQSDEAHKIFYDAYKSKGLESVTLFTDTIPTLDYFKKENIPLGVVSNKRFDNLRIEIEHLQLTDFFKAIVGAGEANSDKPAPDPIFLALSRMNLEPGPDIWFVGDTIADYLAAKAAKCTPIMVGEHHGQAHMKSHQHVGELREIYESLNQ